MKSRGCIVNENISIKLFPGIKAENVILLQEELGFGKIAAGEATIEDVGEEIFRLILEIASGNKKAWADYWGIENALCLFNPAPIT